MVEGRVLFGSLVASIASVILVVILGLRYLGGTLGGSYAVGSASLAALFIAVVTVVLILSFTRLLKPRRAEPVTRATAKA